jgi:hypothetical protein
LVGSFCVVFYCCLLFPVFSCIAFFTFVTLSPLLLLGSEHSSLKHTYTLTTFSILILLTSFCISSALFYTSYDDLKVLLLFVVGFGFLLFACLLQYWGLSPVPLLGKHFTTELHPQPGKFLNAFYLELFSSSLL